MGVFNQPAAREWANEHYIPFLTPFAQQPPVDPAELTGSPSQLDAMVELALFRTCLQRLAKNYPLTITGLSLSEPGVHLLVGQGSETLPIMGVDGHQVAPLPPPVSYTIPGRPEQIPVAHMAFSEEAAGLAPKLSCRINNNELISPVRFILEQFTSPQDPMGPIFKGLLDKALQNVVRVGDSEPAAKYLLTVGGVL